MSSNPFFDKNVLSLEDLKAICPLERNTQFIGCYPQNGNILASNSERNESMFIDVEQKKCFFCPYTPMLSQEDDTRSNANQCFKRVASFSELTDEEQVRLLRVQFGRVTESTSEGAVFDSESQDQVLCNGDRIHVSECLFGKDNEVRKELEGVFYKCAEQAVCFQDPHLPRLDLKYIDLHIYKELSQPAQKDANFFLQKLNDYIIHSLPQDDIFDDPLSHTYLRCLMFVHVFHPTLSYSQMLRLADRYYLTTGMSEFNPDE